jgi:hypothetical protein
MKLRNDGIRYKLRSENRASCLTNCQLPDIRLWVELTFSCVRFEEPRLQTQLEGQSNWGLYRGRRLPPASFLTVVWLKALLGKWSKGPPSGGSAPRELPRGTNLPCRRSWNRALLVNSRHPPQSSPQRHRPIRGVRIALFRRPSVSRGSALCLLRASVASSVW